MLVVSMLDWYTFNTLIHPDNLYMTNHELSPDYTKQQLLEFFSTMHDAARRHTRSLSTNIAALSDQEQQGLVDKVNPYVRFELQQRPELQALPLLITGTGMLYVSDLEGNIMGAETVTEGDLVTGKFIDACVLPIPTIECLAVSDGEEIPVMSQVLSPVIILEAGQFCTDPDTYGEYQIEHDLSNFQICLPLAHYLKVSVAPTQ